MANTLRRKMFKLGGSANTHGVGITSGLKMKKGGSVTTPIGVGSGKQPMKMGPDGKMREGHVAPIASLLFGPSMALLRSGAGLLGRGLGSKFLSRFAGRGPGVKEFVRFGDDAAKLRSGAPISVSGLGGSRAAQAMRAARLATGPAGLGLTGAGIISAATPDISEKTQKEIPLANLIQGTRDVILEPGASFSPLGAVTGLLTGKGVAGNIEDLVGKTKAPVVGSGDESKTTKTIKKQEDEFAGLSDKAERMAAAIRKENNIGTLSQAALRFGQSASAGDDLATALATGSQPIFDELGRRRDLTENIGGLLAQQVLADEATQGAMIAEAAKTGDPAAVNRMQKYFDGYNEGVTNILPIDAKGKPDYSNMAPSTVYMDLEGVSGSRYVAVNADGSETKSFDSVEDANAFAQS